MRFVHYIPIWIVLLLSACTSDEAVPDADEQGNLTILFNVGSEKSTKTVLSSSDNLQHVENVHLYIFNGINDAATYVRTLDFSWPAPGGVGFQGTSHSYPVTLAPGAYTLLAIGLDDKSGATYNLPAAITTGTTLSTARAIIASGKTKTDIAQSELFAGYAVAPDVQLGGNLPITIHLERRVAGIIGWFKNIPFRLPELTNGSIVDKMTIELYTNQNKAISLKKATTDDYGTTPFADDENGMNNKIVLEYDLSSYAQMAGKNVYDVTAIDANNSLQAGSYILPVMAPTTAPATLILRFYDATDTEIYRTSRIIKLDSSINPATTAFSLDANQLYSIGTKDTPIDLDPGIGGEIIIKVNPMWEGISDDIPLE